MIEPLRFNKENYPSVEISHCVYCTNCLAQKHTRTNPNVASIYCDDCSANVTGERENGAYLCKNCTENIHNVMGFQDHRRHILVVGPGLRKKVITRGNGVSFPKRLDEVKIRLRVRIFNNGRLIHREPPQQLVFNTGLTGRVLHVQLLGARRLVGGDFNITGASSDPFVVYSYGGRTLGSSRIRPRSLNPKWDNETFLVPMMTIGNDKEPNEKKETSELKDIVRFEVYDHDWFTQHEFLGHLEIPRPKLLKLAAISNEKPVRLPLSIKEHHGTLHMLFGYDNRYLYIKILRAESLEKVDLNVSNGTSSSNPYVQVFLGRSNADNSDKTAKPGKLIGTTSVMSNNIFPDWEHTAGTTYEFKIELIEVLSYEKEIIASKASKLTPSFSNRRRVQPSSNVDDEEQMIDRIINEANNDNNNNNNNNNNNKFFDMYLSQLKSTQANQSYSMSSTLFTIDIRDHRRFRKHAVLGNCEVTYDVLRRILPDFPTFENYVPFDDSSTNNVNRMKSISSLNKFLKSPSLNRNNLSLSPMKIIMNDIKSKSKNDSRVPPPPPPSITWSEVCSLSVMKVSDKNTADINESDRGELILRLIPSNRGHVIAGLDEGVRSMTLGERAKIKCRYDYAYSHYCMSSNLPPRSNMILDVELLEINGGGQYGAIYFPFLRLSRFFRRQFHAIQIIISHCISKDSKKKDDEDNENDPEKSSKKMKPNRKNRIQKNSLNYWLERFKMMIRLIPYRDLNNNDDDEDSDRKRADRHMRKHLSKQVVVGANNLWSFSPKKRKQRKIMNNNNNALCKINESVDNYDNKSDDDSDDIDDKKSGKDENERDYY
eukprot:gene15098-20315_t